MILTAVVPIECERIEKESNPTERWRADSQLHCSPCTKVSEIFFTIIQTLIIAIFIPLGIWLCKYTGLYGTLGVALTACSVAGTAYAARQGTQKILEIVNNTLFPYDHLQPEITRRTAHRLATAKLCVIVEWYKDKLTELRDLGVLTPEMKAKIHSFCEQKAELKELKKQIQLKQDPQMKPSTREIIQQIRRDSHARIRAARHALEIEWTIFQFRDLTATLPFEWESGLATPVDGIMPPRDLNRVYEAL